MTVRPSRSVLRRADRALPDWICRRARPKPFDRAIELAHQTADAQRQHELPLHSMENLLPVAGDDEQLFAVGEIAQRLRRPHRRVGLFFQWPQAAADFLQAETVARQILDHLQTDQIVKRIKPLGAATAGGLDRRPQKPLLVPVLQLAQTDTDDAAGGLAIVGIHERSASGMETTMFPSR